MIAAWTEVEVRRSGSDLREEDHGVVALGSFCFGFEDVCRSGDRG